MFNLVKFMNKFDNKTLIIGFVVAFIVWIVLGRLSKIAHRGMKIRPTGGVALRYHILSSLTSIVELYFLIALVLFLSMQFTIYINNGDENMVKMAFSGLENPWEILNTVDKVLNYILIGGPALILLKNLFSFLSAARSRVNRASSDDFGRF